MKVGVYIDAFNLYYGARSHCGRGTKGWRWLDVRKLVNPFVGWSGATIDRVVYCTARVDQVDSPNSWVDQDVYISALVANGSVTQVKEGRYVSWAKTEPLVASHRESAHPSLYAVTGTETLDSRLPLTITHDKDFGHDVILAKVRRREEKGSDVNVASCLLRDAFTGQIEAAVVITNDSDLGLPLAMAREVIPVGTINPQSKPRSEALKGLPTDGVGRHWWRSLTCANFLSNQLPDPVGSFRKPIDW